MSISDVDAQDFSNEPDFDALITLNLKDADIQDVFRLIGEQHNLNILIASEDLYGTITLRLQDVKLGIAFDLLLEKMNAYMEMKVPSCE